MPDRFVQFDEMTPAQRQLHDLMIDISTDYFAAMWQTGLEEICLDLARGKSWESVMDEWEYDRETCPDCRPSQEQIDRLRALIMETGGIWRFENEWWPVAIDNLKK